MRIISFFDTQYSVFCLFVCSFVLPVPEKFCENQIKKRKTFPSPLHSTIILVCFIWIKYWISCCLVTKKKKKADRGKKRFIKILIARYINIITKHTTQITTINVLGQNWSVKRGSQTTKYKCKSNGREVWKEKDA